MKNKKRQSTEYEVGYKKPPRKNQFKPGQSGNPKGRPKLVKNFIDDLREEAEEILTIMENGKKVKITKQRAFIKKLTAMALSGDKTLMRVLSELLNKAPIKVEDIGKDISQGDKEILKAYLERQGGQHE